MSTTDYPLPRIQGQTVHRTRHPATRPRSQLTPAMGPANRAPGLAIMGAPGHARPDVMGGPDAAQTLRLMGRAEDGSRLDVMGDADPRFVDLLFGSGR